MVIQLPDLVIDVLSGEERLQLSLIVPPVTVEHLADAARVRSADAETAEGARDIPVDGAAKRVLEVVPDEASPGAKQVAQRDVPVRRLGPEARFKDDRSQRVEPLAQRADRGALPGIGRSQLAEKTLDIVAQLTRPAELAIVRPQYIVQISQHLTKIARVIGADPRVDPRCRFDIRIPLGERHPQTVMVVGPWRDQVAG